MGEQAKEIVDHFETAFPKVTDYFAHWRHERMMMDGAPWETRGYGPAAMLLQRDSTARHATADDTRTWEKHALRKATDVVDMEALRSWLEPYDEWLVRLPEDCAHCEGFGGSWDDDWEFFECSTCSGTGDSEKLSEDLAPGEPRYGRLFGLDFNLCILRHVLPPIAGEVSVSVGASDEAVAFQGEGWIVVAMPVRAGNGGG